MFDGRLYFRAVTVAAGFELWSTDGTSTGTVMVADLHVGARSSTPDGFVEFGGRLYFAAITGTERELFVTDGTRAGTVLFGDFNGSRNGGVILIAATASALFFRANDGQGLELWASDGTSGGTHIVRDIWPGVVGSNPKLVTVFGDAILFFARDSVQLGLWISDGTAVGTRQIRTFISYRKDSAVIGGRAYFCAQTVTGEELWRTDGTTAGTDLVADIYVGCASSRPSELKTFDGTTGWFVAGDAQHGVELRRLHVDGSISLVRDIRPGPAGSYPGRFTELNGGLLFEASDGEHGYEPWFIPDVLR